jgi:DNA (cytosine-5)-methyltransferase 1
MLCPWCDEWTSGLHSDPVEDCLSCCGAWIARTVNTLSDGAHMGGGLNGQDGNSGRILVDNKGRVRRLTPSECEKLQGFSGEHTLVPYKGKPATECPDGPRFTSIANTMAVPVMRWIGERIAKVEKV